MVGTHDASRISTREVSAQRDPHGQIRRSFVFLSRCFFATAGERFADAAFRSSNRATVQFPFVGNQRILTAHEPPPTDDAARRDDPTPGLRSPFAVRVRPFRSVRPRSTRYALYPAPHTHRVVSRRSPMYTLRRKCSKLKVESVESVEDRMMLRGERSDLY
ncbi:hypothetical protein ALC57_06958 [Trachymyrmex cornetzi]|uniref:Uncharacterized protein n=1 Tax=Trachymyrmex cornetzi TaxID=471704 RepID=A0A195E6C7_9HYME|nr:hypothetical protein ALC57_06958 [Trachymyrmex cornetzi]